MAEPLERPLGNQSRSGNGGGPEEPPPLERNRDFLLLWSTQLVAATGAQVSTIAYPLLVLGLTGSALQAGLVSFVNYFTILVYLPAGVLVDRLNRKHIMVLASLVDGSALMSIAIVFAVGGVPPLWQILIVAFLQGTAVEFFIVAEQSVLRTVVGQTHLAPAVTRNEVRQSLSVLVGPPLGGAMYALGRSIPFLFNGLASLGACVALLGLRNLPGPKNRQSSQSVLKELFVGVRWLWRTSFVRATTLCAAASNVTWGALDLVILVRAAEAGAQPAAIGIMIGMLGAGGLAGAALTRPLRQRFSDPTLIRSLFSYEACLLALLFLTQEPLLMGVVIGMAALGAATLGTIFGWSRLSILPDEVAGSVNAAARLITSSVFPLGVLAAGAIMQATSSSKGVLLLVAWQTALAVTVSASRNIGRGLELSSRSYDRSPAPL